jgi:hypothetical protein
MKHKPEDIDIVEWHYLMMCFGTDEKFKVQFSLCNYQLMNGIEIVTINA